MKVNFTIIWKDTMQEREAMQQKANEAKDGERSPAEIRRIDVVAILDAVTCQFRRLLDRVDALEKENDKLKSQPQFSSEPRIHVLKTLEEEFEAVRQGVKTAEFRKNDRNFMLGDRLVLKKFDHKSNTFLGSRIEVAISHIVAGPDFGIPIGFVMMSLDLNTMAVIHDYTFNAKTFNAKK